eukprot:23863-Eustigmatos_ZCMA.PRE.1
MPSESRLVGSNRSSKEAAQWGEGFQAAISLRPDSTAACCADASKCSRRPRPLCSSGTSRYRSSVAVGMPSLEYTSSQPAIATLELGP